MTVRLLINAGCPIKSLIVFFFYSISFPFSVSFLFKPEPNFSLTKENG